jgi:hypothetical protein
VTDYDGNEIPDTPENRARWAGLWYDPHVVNGPRMQSWPFRPAPDNDLPQRPQLPKDQGALNEMVMDKLFPMPEQLPVEERPKIDQSKRDQLEGL